MSTILVVEDEPGIRHVLSERLGGAFPDARILLAESAEAGLELAARTRPGVIVLDLTLRGMDGFAFARRARELAGPVAVVAVTGDVREATRERAEREGFAAFFVKPELGGLTAVVARLLAGESGRERGPATR